MSVEYRLYHVKESRIKSLFSVCSPLFSLVMLIIFSLLFIAQMSFHAFKGISPLQVSKHTANG